MHSQSSATASAGGILRSVYIDSSDDQRSIDKTLDTSAANPAHEASKTSPTAAAKERARKAAQEMNDTLYTPREEVGDCPVPHHSDGDEVNYPPTTASSPSSPVRDKAMLICASENIFSGVTLGRTLKEMWTVIASLSPRLHEHYQRLLVLPQNNHQGANASFSAIDPNARHSLVFRLIARSASEHVKPLDTEDVFREMRPLLASGEMVMQIIDMEAPPSPSRPNSATLRPTSAMSRAENEDLPAKRLQIGGGADDHATKGGAAHAPRRSVVDDLDEVPPPQPPVSAALSQDDKMVGIRRDSRERRLFQNDESRHDAVAPQREDTGVYVSSTMKHRGPDERTVNKAATSERRRSDLPLDQPLYTNPPTPQTSAPYYGTSNSTHDYSLLLAHPNMPVEEPEAVSKSGSTTLNGNVLLRSVAMADLPNSRQSPRADPTLGSDKGVGNLGHHHSDQPFAAPAVGNTAALNRSGSSEMPIAAVGRMKAAAIGIRGAMGVAMAAAGHGSVSADGRIKEAGDANEVISSRRVSIGGETPLPESLLYPPPPITIIGGAPPPRYAYIRFCYHNEYLVMRPSTAKGLFGALFCRREKSVVYCVKGPDDTPSAGAGRGSDDRLPMISSHLSRSTTPPPQQSYSGGRSKEALGNQAKGWGMLRAVAGNAAVRNKGTFGLFGPSTAVIPIKGSVTATAFSFDPVSILPGGQVSELAAPATTTQRGAYVSVPFTSPTEALPPYSPSPSSPSPSPYLPNYAISTVSTSNGVRSYLSLGPKRDNGMSLISQRRLDTSTVFVIEPYVGVGDAAKMVGKQMGTLAQGLPSGSPAQPQLYYTIRDGKGYLCKSAKGGITHSVSPNAMSIIALDVL